MDNETKKLALGLIALCGVFVILLSIALDRETERENKQRQSWIEQGFQIGEQLVLENPLQDWGSCQKKVAPLF